MEKAKKVKRFCLYHQNEDLIKKKVIDDFCEYSNSIKNVFYSDGMSGILILYTDILTHLGIIDF